MKIAVNVHLKKGVLDPQGKAVLHALETLGFSNVKDVRVGKQILIILTPTTKIRQLKRLKKWLMNFLQTL